MKNGINQRFPNALVHILLLQASSAGSRLPTQSVLDGTRGYQKSVRMMNDVTVFIPSGLKS